MNIAISGMGGFIGSYLSLTLGSAGNTVIRIPRELLHSSEGLPEFFNKIKPDEIYHLAGYGNMINQTDIPMTVVANYMGTWSMLRASQNIPYTKFVFVSSSSTFLAYETFYSASKGGAERLAKAFRNTYKKPVYIMRPYSVYGPGESDSRFIPTVCKCLIRSNTLNLDPEPHHDWVYIDDLVNTMITIHEDADIGSGRSLTNADIVAKLEKISFKKAKIRYTKNTRPFDTENWKSDECWTKTPIEEGLRITYEYYQRRFT